MGKALWIAGLLTLIGACGPAGAGSLAGEWLGKLQATPQVALRLVLHIHETPEGAYEASLDSVDQGAMGLAIADLQKAEGDVRFDVPKVRGAFAGRLDADAQTLTGTWTQGPAALPLAFEKLPQGADAPAVNRPQTPHPPFPYRSEDVTFAASAPKVRLAGVLTRPQGPGPFPAVVLIAGSGPNDRDETILGHKPFLVLADALTRQGIAVLRYDKRGVGSSTGDYGTATSLDFADDAQAAATWLSAQNSVDPQRVGLIGHSEGGLIAPMVAARDPAIAFIVLLAGPGVDGAKILAEQGRLMSLAMGVSRQDSEREAALRDQMIAVVATEKDPAVVQAKLKALTADYGAKYALSAVAKALLTTQSEAINSDWFRTFFTYDPAPALRRLRIPVLALIGEKDLQVPADQNIPALRAALAQDPRATVEILPGLNHLFQPAKTGSVADYGQIETTLAPAVLDQVTAWILHNSGGSPGPADRP